MLVTVRAAIERARAGEGPQAVEASRYGWPRPRRPRRLPLRPGRDARVLRGAVRPCRRLAARLALDGLGAAEIDGLREAAAGEVAAGLAEAEQAPAPDPGTIEDGVYAAPPFA